MAQTTAISKIDQFKGLLNSGSIRAQLVNSLKENAGAFMSSMLDLYSTDGYLQECDPEAVAKECLKAAILNLPIVKSLGFAYIVPYKGKPTFMIGYRGLIQLAQRTGQYKTINEGIIYDGELIGINKLSGEIDISGKKKSDNVVGYFAYFKLINGFEKTVFMTKEDVEAWRDKYSPSAKTQFSPWKTEFDSMALKTCLKRAISRFGIMSPEIQMVLESENEDVPQAKAEINATINMQANKGDVIEVKPKQIETQSSNNTQQHSKASAYAPNDDMQAYRQALSNGKAPY